MLPYDRLISAGLMRRRNASRSHVFDQKVQGTRPGSSLERIPWLCVQNLSRSPPAEYHEAPALGRGIPVLVPYVDPYRATIAGEQAAQVDQPVARWFVGEGTPLHPV